MASIDPRFKSSIFRKDFPVIIASNRGSAIMKPVRLRYHASGYAAGEVLARNTSDGLYQKYADAGASGTGTAAAILFEAHPVEDFDGTSSSGSVMAVAIFGQCTVYKDNLTGWDSAAATDLAAKEIVDATGVTTIKF